MGWTPAVGAQALLARLGHDEAETVLVGLMAGEVPVYDCVVPPHRFALLDIGDGHAERLMADESGRRLVYWPRVWAARALAYVGSTAVGPQLAAATHDEHWRVRMTATQTIGRLGIEGLTDSLVERLDDPHPRVRSAALLALERVGSEDALQRVSRLLAGTDRHRAERTIAAILDRTETPQRQPKS